ncbi:MAG: helix-turn-helix domain-containing protein [Oscillospiraceae bacterium]|jgi:two-component system response regulator YesN|nr:helix-turn-helix domain-containing protein [Oscillospiraceae bacterium]
MRIVIVENDIPVCRDFVGIIDKFAPHHVVTCIGCGKENVNAVMREKPDIIITGIRAPKCDNLDMLLSLAAMGVAVNVLIASRYTLVDYIKSVLKPGIAEFMPESVSTEDFLDGLNRMERKISIRGQGNITLQGMILMLLSGNGTRRDEFIRGLKYELNVHENSLLSAVIIKPQDESAETTVRIMASLRDCLCKNSRTKCHVLHLPFHYGILVLGIDVQNDDSYRSRVISAIGNVRSISGCVAAGRRFNRLESLEEIVISLRSMLIYSMVCEEIIIFDCDVVASMKYREATYPTSLGEQMIQAIANKSAEQIYAVSSIFKAEMFKVKYDPKSIVNCFNQYLYNAYRTIREHNTHSPESFIYHDCFKKVTECSDKQELIRNFDLAVQWIASESEKITDVHNLIIIKAINYLRDHYNENISLGQIADILGVTPEYLSALFNREMNINFSKFLKNFRISSAKKLLLTDTQKVQEIAEAVGFSDPKYFNRVFKEVCGESPTSYKKRHRY